MKKHFAPRLQLLVTIALVTVFVRAAHADVIMDWNAKGDAIAAEKQFLLQTRVMSMLHIAMFEAVNAIERRYAPYKLTLAADRSTSKEAAAATAAHDVLLAIYPDQKTMLDAALSASLSSIPESDGKAKGIALGKEAAEGVIALRANDGADARESYRHHTKAGVYVPTVIPIFATFGASNPWVMTSGCNSPRSAARAKHDRGPETSMEIVNLVVATAPSGRQSKRRWDDSGSWLDLVPSTQSSDKPRSLRAWMS